jgi:hypothetical protein
LNYAGLGLDAHAEAQHGGRSILTGGGRIPLDLRFGAVAERRLDLPLRVSISADSLPPALPLGLLDGFSNIRGRIDGTVALEGTTLDPSLSGGFTLRAASADWDVTGLGYRDASGSFLLEGDRLVNVNLVTRAVDPRARAGRGIAAQSGGAGVVSGRLDLTTLSDPIFQLTLTADRTYAAKRRDVEAVVSGTVVLGGRYTRPEISGSLRIDQGTLDIDEIYRQYLVVGLELDDPGLLSIVDTSLVAVRPLLATSQNPFLRNLDVRNLQVAVANESWLRSRDMDVEVTGNLNVTFDRRQEDLRLTGVLNVERGTYTLYYPPLQSRRFQVRQGVVEFPGTPGLDPNLSITAAYRARAQGEPLDVLAVVSGTLQGPRVRLSSDAQPPISESDLASYLFFGVPTWEVASTGGPNAADMRGITGLGVRAIAPSVLGLRVERTADPGAGRRPAGLRQPHGRRGHAHARRQRRPDQLPRRHPARARPIPRIHRVRRLLAAAQQRKLRPGRAPRMAIPARVLPRNVLRGPLRAHARIRHEVRLRHAEGVRVFAVQGVGVLRTSSGAGS